ncbi:MAG: TIGR00730 family Rossman fold protein [Epsilonproteobacteria bacterium]|nr:TIGR00730 family Rossman fold protein [Campylobacterota bacterium]
MALPQNNTLVKKYLKDIKSADTWSVFKIISDFVKGFDELSDLGPSVTVFGSARFDENNKYYQQARELASILAHQGFSIVTGGGPGIMEAANRGAFEAGGVESIGLNIDLPHEQLPNPYATKTLEFEYFFSRKVMLVKYSMAYVIFPGGFGTLDELFESLTLVQTKKVTGVKIFLVGKEFFEPLIEFLEKSLLAHGTISKEDLELFEVCDDLYEIAQKIHTSLLDQLHSIKELGLANTAYYKSLEKLKERIEHE